MRAKVPDLFGAFVTNHTQSVLVYSTAVCTCSCVVNESEGAWFVWWLCCKSHTVPSAEHRHVELMASTETASLVVQEHVLLGIRPPHYHNAMYTNKPTLHISMFTCRASC